MPRIAPLLLAASVVAALAVAGCGGGGGDESGDEPSAFGYDADAPLAVRDGGVVAEERDLVVRDVSFAVPGGRVEGLLVAPRDAKGLPAVVYVHGAAGDRTSMTVPASWLAARGAVALTLTQPSTRSTGEADDLSGRLGALREAQVADVVAVRRAIDFLSKRPDVDPDRIGYVGWSAGARTGALVGGIDDRLQALVLVSGGASPVEEYVAAAPVGVRPELRRVMTEIDPLRWLAQVDGSRLLLQNGSQDQLVPRAALDAFAAASEGADVRWYDADHALGTVEAQDDQLEWLSERLGIDGPVVAGMPTGPE